MLLIFTIAVVIVRFLLEALRRVAEGLESERAVANRAKRQLQNNKIRTLTTGLPAFSDFGPAFRAAPTSPDGDVRGACYAGYHDTDGEFIPLDQAAPRRTTTPLHHLGPRPGAERLRSDHRLPDQARRQRDPRLPTRPRPSPSSPQMLSIGSLRLGEPSGRTC